MNKKINVSNLTTGSILSETSFFTVEKVNSTNIEVRDDNGNQLTIGKDYVEKILDSADIYENEEKKTMTELAELLINSPRIAMTVAFYKKDTEKTKKAYEAEKQEKIQEIQNAKVADLPGLLNDLIENPLSKVIPGELRVMKGRHYGNVDDLGRLHFVDMEIQRTKTDYDDRMRQIDPRTVVYIIVGNTKFTLKK
jgi:hypothetical protein